jgi:hypothetical protein
MLSKCANPDCSTVFRYPHEGKLWLIFPTTAVSVREKRTSKLSANKIKFHLPIAVTFSTPARFIAK